jgi:hypothetical protein
MSDHTYSTPNKSINHIYVDESIHVQGDFIATAAIFSDRDLQAPIERILRQCGLTPGVDEFKSSNPMNGNETSQYLRSGLRSVLHDQQCRVALAFSHISERTELDIQVLELISSAIQRDSSKADEYYLSADKGIMRSATRAQWRSCEDTYRINILPNDDSRSVYGLQLADMCAHSAAMVIKGKTGHSTKRIFVGEESGYRPGTAIGLDFELWASLRYNLASNEVAVLDPESKVEMPERYMKPFGLNISAGCSSDVRQAAQTVFGKVYLGCIH